MQLCASAIVCAARPHGESGVVARLLTAEAGLVAGYVAGGRGRGLRPVLIPGNVVAAVLHARAEGQMPSARLELVASRGPWLAEPLAASAIGWVTALTATALPERHAYPPIHAALAGVLDAICHAPAARGWAQAIVVFEALLLRELGYGDHRGAADAAGADPLAAIDRMGRILGRYPLADRRGDVMAARALLRDRLARAWGFGGHEGRA
ncbi:MAG: recombination protein O N-terminal domain-containing protein [Sphingomonadales bacterium]|nr:recombination protein O N-terminal domain-containing protein [Sphingomonadales bacterium]